MGCIHICICKRMLKPVECEAALGDLNVDDMILL
jgi:hypothetical protein